MNKRKMTEQEKVNYFNSKRDWLNRTFDILKNRLNKTNNLDMITVMDDHLCKLIEDIDVYRVEDLKQQLINQIEENKLLFKYKYETVSAVQYIKPKEENIKNRFDHLPSWLEEYIHDNMILNQEVGCDPIVICSSYKDKIQCYGHEKHLLKQGDWIVRTMKDNNTFCYSDDLFKWFYEKE